MTRIGECLGGPHDGDTCLSLGETAVVRRPALVAKGGPGHGSVWDESGLYRWDRAAQVWRWEPAA